MAGNFEQTGDHRDIPMALGMAVITWNRCEETLQDILYWLSSKGRVEARRAIEPLISDLSSLAITHALGCYTTEFPENELQIAQSLKHGLDAFERCRAYRNYYVHGFDGVTRYGFKLSQEDFEAGAPIHELMREGPFGTIHHKTAKGKTRFALDFVSVEKILEFSNHLADLLDYLDGVRQAVADYFNRPDDEDRAAPPEPIVLIDPLVKPFIDHFPGMRRPPALAPRVHDDGDSDDDMEVVTT